jgi:hypothetical protein
MVSRKSQVKTRLSASARFKQRVTVLFLPSRPLKASGCSRRLTFRPARPSTSFFLQTVNSVPSDHLHECDLGDVVVYVAAYVDLLVARGELKASGGNIIDGKVNPLINVVRDCGRTVNALARSLRLSPIARTPLLQKQEPQNLSYYQRQALAEASDDGQANGH